MSRLREMRKERGWSISRFSHESGTNASIVGMVERQNLRPSADFRRRVSAALGVGESELFDANGFAI
jgi:transcriptional regulator with XRE-family HTH domain